MDLQLMGGDERRNESTVKIIENLPCLSPQWASSVTSFSEQ